MIRRLLRAAGSPACAVASLAALMVLVVLVVLCQLRWDAAEAARRCLRGAFVWAPLPGTGRSLPALPGGVLVGAALLAGLVAALVSRLRSRRRLGLWLLHAGLAGLVLGEFVSARWAVDARLSLERGGSSDLAEGLPLGFRLTLKDFRRTDYPGSGIPQDFSSVVHISGPGRGEERDALISMNRPLRYRGRSIYQAGYAGDGGVSVLQVVDNPGRRLPYVSFALVGAGLLLELLGRREASRRRTEA